MSNFRKRMFFAFVLVVILLTIGTLYYSHAERWSLVDSFYFSTMTLTTIGYGDLAPTGDWAKIFTSIYAIFGIGIMLYILSSVVGVSIFSQERKVSRAFSFLSRLRRHEKEIVSQKKEIKKLEKKVKPSIQKFEKHEKELEELQREVNPTIKKFEEQQKELKKLKKKIRKK